MSGHHYTGVATNEEFEAIHHLKRTNTQTVLSALLLGLEVKLGEHTYRLFEQVGGGYCPGIVEGERLICGMPDLSLAAFTSMCDKISEDDLLSLHTNYCFNMMRQK